PTRRYYLGQDVSHANPTRTRVTLARRVRVDLSCRGNNSAPGARTKSHTRTYIFIRYFVYLLDPSLLQDRPGVSPRRCRPMPTPLLAREGLACSVLRGPRSWQGGSGLADDLLAVAGGGPGERGPPSLAPRVRVKRISVPVVPPGEYRGVGSVRRALQASGGA